ncbi:hypothetical protein L5515_003078 [Caenorhabditis briggsae]|uniref:Uncharacterized protein n=1 Tax=Caenorhabditis briggsae TaxID=6238 RepID=A0AAE9D8M5_CAEBR|nr:hypothetical protein L3Y34_000204 [Caenorhabditis briggsae]UMM21368.1 hypothetical protein L5515_003078 [Caenorhabditis briggsae]
MSSQEGSSENTENSDPGENQCAEKPKAQKSSKNFQVTPAAVHAPAKSAGSAPFRSFDLKQLSSEMKRMADGGKLFNMMREVDRMGGMRGLMRRRGRGGGAGGRGRGNQPTAASPDEPSTSSG